MAQQLYSDYAVVWPRSAKAVETKPLAKRLDTLAGKTVAFLWFDLQYLGPRSPRNWVASGPASTRVRSITRRPARGPFHKVPSLTSGPAGIRFPSVHAALRSCLPRW
jgi:hypothetical protein